MKFYVESFGCQMNTADSQEMGRRLAARGLTYTQDPADADVFLLNTCTVRDHAEHRALSLLGRLAEWKRPDRYIIFAGCAAERLGETVRRRFPQVTVVAGAKSIDRFESLLDGKIPEFDAVRERSDAWGWLPGDKDVLPGPAVGHVTIMRGCNFACSYCIVPSVRGREAYRPAESILGEVRDRVEQGQGEILLLGQTVNSYRPAAPQPAEASVSNFAELLRAVARVPGMRRIRFMSPHPFYVDEAFTAALGELPEVAPHIHLPSQSGSDRMLAAMRRNYTRAGYLEKLSLLRRRRPGLSVTTDIIVGYPGESEGDFDATMSFVREAQFDGAYIFKYSPRPGTASAVLEDEVAEGLKEERLARLAELTEAASRRFVETLVGTEQEVLVESVEGNQVEGRTAHNRKLFMESSEEVAVGAFVMASVEKADGRTLYGSRTDERKTSKAPN